MRNAGGIMNGFQFLFNWLAKLAYLNILWIIFSLFGLIVFGIGPATVSVFTIIRKWLQGDQAISTWKQFSSTFRESFWGANGLMLCVLPVCVFIYTDFMIVRTLPYSFMIDKIVFPSIIILTLLTVIFISYLIAVYVHFDVSFFMNFKYALILAGVSPMSALLILVGLFTFFIIIFIIPAVTLFYLISVPVLIIQCCALRGFHKNFEQKKS